MPAASLYTSARMARGYAFSRPPVHARVIAIVRQRLLETGWAAAGDPGGTRALDVGCGAGRSTAALAPLAGTRVGLEPAAPMLAYRRDVAPGARFAIGRAEHLPFAGGVFDLVAAAGSLNYADLDRFLPEAARVMTARGLLVVYDFSAGRRLREDRRLDAWFASFEQRYPFPPGYALDARTLRYAEAGLRLVSYETFEVSVTMTLDTYLDYVLSEANVEVAVTGGTREEEVAAWCRATLRPFFPAPAADVLFDGDVALAARA